MQSTSGTGGSDRGEPREKIQPSSLNTRSSVFLGYSADLIIDAPSAPVLAQIALPFCSAGALVKAVAALRGPDGEPPFALLALRPGRDRSVQEEAQDAAHAALDTLAGLIAAGQLEPDGAAIAQRLAHLTEMASRAAWRAQP